MGRDLFSNVSLLASAAAFGGNHAGRDRTSRASDQVTRAPTSACPLSACLRRAKEMHKTLKMMPAMAAGVSATLWSMDDICEKMNAVAPKLGLRPSQTKAVA